MATIFDYDFSEPRWMAVARREFGQRENPHRSEHNARIVEYLSTTKTNNNVILKTDENEWCAAFMNWCMQRAGIVGTGSTGSLSWQHWGQNLVEPVFGCIVVLKRPKAGPNKGHVGFYVDEVRNKVRLLGGNQSDSVCLKLYPKHNILKYKWPIGSPHSSLE